MPSTKVRHGVSYAQADSEQSLKQLFGNKLSQRLNSQPSNGICALKQMKKGLKEQMGGYVKPYHRVSDKTQRNPKT